MKCLFDLDETLIHSDSLNCDAYNYALEKCGYPRIEDCLRLTRDSLQFIPASDLKKIIRIKQNYFTRSWLPCRIVLNTALLQRIRGYGKKNCYLWTSASKQRALSVLRRCKLKHFFNRILFDKKTNISASMQKLKGQLHSDKFIIFENDPTLFENHHIQIMERIVSEKFHVYVYSVDIR